MTHEWTRMNGVRLQIKDLQFIESETVVSIYKISKNNSKDVLLAEVEKILITTQGMVQVNVGQKVIPTTLP